MKLSPGVAAVIPAVLAAVGSSAPDLSQFKDEIDPEALRTILKDAKITHVVFHASVKGTIAEQISRELKKTVNFAA